MHSDFICSVKEPGLFIENSLCIPGFQCGTGMSCKRNFTNVLSYMIYNGLNMTKIESWLILENLGILFSVDFEEILVGRQECIMGSRRPVGLKILG